MKHYLMTVSMLFTLVLSMAAQEFNKSQGYRLEIGEGLALDCQNGTLTFSPVNKKAMTQVWQIHPSSRPGYNLLFNPYGTVALDNGNNGSREAEVMTWDASEGNPNQQWKIQTLADGTVTLTCAAGDLKLGYNDNCQPGGRVWQMKATDNDVFVKWHMRTRPSTASIRSPDVLPCCCMPTRRRCMPMLPTRSPGCGPTAASD